uniref:Uncharacterized protein n=1 Tax=viral metagenome TaxID=1070528 RepID=A0A6C0FBE6_9ZZZZ|tara:strand:- start:818 stop:1222 length:405 start_codon:yes stop_codon:yes gene_type:complete
MPLAFKKNSRKNIKNKELFTQRPDNFPHSKVDDFSQNWQIILNEFDAKLNLLLGDVSGSGPYITERDLQLAIIGSAILKGDYNSINTILQMENSLKNAALDIQQKTKKLQNIQNQLNLLDNNKTLKDINVDYEF